MPETPAPVPPPAVWFTTPRFRRAVFAALAAVVLIEGYQAVFVRTNDVANHFHNGRRLVGLEDVPSPPHPYHYWYVPYPAGRSTLNATLAWLPYYSFRAACYLLGLAALAASLVVWERMARGGRPVSTGVPFAAASGAVFLLLPWVVRDLDDCGLQLMLLFMLTAVFDLCRRGREKSAGVWLGVAIVFKASPLLLVPVLGLTGRWRACATAGVTVAALSVSPAAFIGWEATGEVNAAFVALTRANGNLGNPTENGFEPPRHQNQGLMISLGRLFQTYPPDHPLYLSHPLFVQFLDLPPATADRAAKAVVASLLLYVVGWRYLRRRWADGPAADTVREAAALTALCAILSPMTWIQHLTLCIPAAYLVCRDGYERLINGHWPLRRNAVGIAAVVVLVYVFAREVTGRELSIVFLSYKVNTLAALVLIGLVLALPAVGVRAATDHVEVRSRLAERVRRGLPRFARPGLTRPS